MANTVLNDAGYAYDPYFYATQAILALEKNLVMAGSVYRGYDRQSAQKGSFINIRRPDTFTVQDAPSTAQDVDPTQIQIKLDRWKEVKFKLTDKELTLSAEQLINDHIHPMAYALSAELDTSLMGLGLDVPWFTDLSSTPAVSDITASRRILHQNNVPVSDMNNMFLIVDPVAEEGFLNLTAFSQNQGAGNVGVNTQINGLLGTKYGFNIQTSQNVASFTKGTASTTALAVNGAVAKGLSTVALDTGSVTGTLVKGDVIKFAGHSQQYAVTALSTASSNAFTSVSITPELQSAVADNEVVTVYQDNHTVNLGFHRNAFALATAPLSTMGQELGGVRMATVTLNNISLRSRMYYVGGSSSVEVALDILYGVKTLDPNKAVRLRG